ncbi:MAG: TetR/AcrR family transcriptional regulator [Opitutaceae bacterium]|nr:TetR/AcrR family transcriptional regulator [Opitutaceae bacterium]
MNELRRVKNPEETRRRILEATIRLLLRQGFNATTVDQICEEARVTKGSFFHHFQNKDAVGVAAVRAWGAFGGALYANAWRDPSGPIEEIHRLIDIMVGFTEREEPCVCVVGMMSQEMSRESEAFREACASELDTWTEMMRTRLAKAKEEVPAARDFDPKEVAWFLNSLWQGSMLVAKARQDPELIRANLRLARQYIDSLFAPATQMRRGSSLPPLLLA